MVLLGGAVLGAVGADEVGGGRTEQLPAAHPADHRDRRFRVPGPPHRGQHLLLQVGPGAGREPLRVAEDRHRLRGPHQQVRGEAAGGEDPGEVLRGGPLVAQEPQVPRGLAERVGHLAEAEEPGVRIGGVREPAEQHRQQGALDGGLAGHAGRQGLQVAQGGGRVGVPERFQADRGGLRAEPGLPGGELGDGVQQRPVEDLLVQPPYDGGVPLPRLVQLGHRVGAHPERPAQPPQVRLVVGDQVGAAEPVELDAVFHGAQEAVRLVELGGVRAPHVPALGELPQRLQGGAAAQGGVAAPVYELEELHRELDVPQAAGAELQLPVDPVGGDVVDDAAAHLLHVGDEVLPVGGLPDQRGDRVHVLCAQLRVAGHRARLEQGLELPGLGPALVVGEVGAEGAHERSVAALGAQVGVDLPDGALDGGLGADPHHVGGQPGGGLHGLGLVRPVPRLRDEDHIDVGDVVQLAPAALAHRDDGEPAPRGVLGGGRTGDGEGGAQGGGGEVGQLRGGLFDAGGPADVPGGKGEQAPAVGDAQRVRVGGLGEAALELGDARVQVDRLVGDERLPVAGVPGQVVAQRLGRAEDPEEPVAQGLGGDEGVQQHLPVALLLRLHDPDEAAQGQVRVGGGPERLQQHRIGPYGGERVQVEELLGGGRVGESVPQQSGERTASAPRRGRHPCSPASRTELRCVVTPWRGLVAVQQRFEPRVCPADQDRTGRGVRCGAPQGAGVPASRSDSGVSATPRGAVPGAVDPVQDPPDTP